MYHVLAIIFVIIASLHELIDVLRSIEQEMLEPFMVHAEYFNCTLPILSLIYTLYIECL